MKKLVNLFRANTFFIGLVLVWVLIVLINHVPGTYLSGWDTLHPEFNFSLSLERIFFGVWRGEQGVGAVAAHAHMSELPRVILLWISSVVIPNSLLRYSYISVCLLLGILGVYFFITRILLDKLEPRIAGAFAAMGALFYLFNLGTLQHFYFPFEMFQTQYAYLPWLFLTAVNFLNNPSRRNIFWFALITILSTPMAFASTLWFAYFLALLTFLFFYLRSHIKQVLTLVVVTLFINSFWLLPNLYFLFSGAAVDVTNAKINKIFSEEAFLNNQNYGDLLSTLVLKNYLFDWPVFKSAQGFKFALDAWDNHLAHSWVRSIGYGFSLVVILGGFKAYVSRNKHGMLLLAPGLIALIFLVNNSLPFSWLFHFLRDNSSVFKEALRFPFTKFSIILMFVASCYFALGQVWIASFLTKVTKLKLMSLQVIVVLGLCIVYMFPIFQGEFISKYVQVKIPAEYFQMFDWFNHQPDGRVAEFPVHSFWGWMYYDWGLQGAQFTSFGIRQPLLNRDYDRWNPQNEDYYRQISYAVYSKNSDLIDQVLDKYNITYLLFDESVSNPGVVSNNDVLFHQQIKQLLKADTRIKLAWSQGKLSVYRYQPKNVSLLGVQTENNYVNSREVVGSYEVDYSLQKYPAYITTENSHKDLPQSNFPFKSLSDNLNIINSDLLTPKNDSLLLKFANLSSSAKLNLATYLDYELEIPVAVFVDTSQSVPRLRLQYRLPQLLGVGDSQALTDIIVLPTSLSHSFLVNVNGQQTLKFVDNLNLSNHDSQGYFIGNTFLASNRLNTLNFYPSVGEAENIINYPLPAMLIDQSYAALCGDKKQNQFFYDRLSRDDNGFKLIAHNAKICVKFDLDKIVTDTHKSSGLLNVKFTSRLVNGLGSYCLWDINQNKCVKSETVMENGLLSDDYVYLNKSLDKYQLLFSLEASNNMDLASAYYSDFSVELLDSKQTNNFPLSGLRNRLNSDSIAIKPGDQLSLDYPSYLLVDNPNILKVRNKSSFCSNTDPLYFDRIVNLDQKYVEYSSIAGSSCDFYAFPNLSHDIGYILTLSAQNISGLPLRICAANPDSKRCDLYTSLPPDKNFKEVNLLIPPMKDGEYGYNIHFDNYSIGNIKTINRIKDLKVVPVPYDWLSQLEFVDNKRVPPAQMSVRAVNQIFPGLIQAQVANFSASVGLLTYDSGYSRGWWMIGFQHVLVDDWENGWLIPGDTKGQVWIVFWPELFQIFGYGLFVLVLVWLFEPISIIRRLFSVMVSRLRVK